MSFISRNNTFFLCFSFSMVLDDSWSSFVDSAHSIADIIDIAHTILLLVSE